LLHCEYLWFDSIPQAAFSITSTCIKSATHNTCFTNLFTVTCFGSNCKPSSDS